MCVRVCVCVLDSHIARLHIQWDGDTHQCILHIHTPPLGIQLSSIQMHNRSRIKQKHSGHTLRTQATAIITLVFTMVHTGVVNVGLPSDFPRGSPHSPPVSLSGVYLVSLKQCCAGFSCKNPDVLSVWITEWSHNRDERRVSSLLIEMSINSN